MKIKSNSFFHNSNTLFLVALISLLLINLPGNSQVLIPGLSQSVSGGIGNNTNPAWSPDGKALLFQSDRYLDWNIFMYIIEKDSLVQLTKNKFNETDPVWYPGRNSIVFTSDESGEDQLYVLDLTTGEQKLLIDRNIQCRNASFSKYDTMVTFSGYDENSKTWQIYTYDFKYNNLNKLTDLGGNCQEPALSPDGKHIAFSYSDQFNANQSSIYVVNWYGDFAFQSTETALFNPSWTPDSFRIIYVNTDIGYTVSSMQKDGTSIFDIYQALIVQENPVISPDGKYMAISFLNDGNFELIFKYIEQE
ncbi:MAG TPA: DPP IV N-terminal domain-containing protein [Bacteroidales bacterium]